MSFDNRKYIYLAIVAVIAAVALYMTYSLIKDGSPRVKSQNEYLVEANGLHADSLYEAAVEPYMKAGSFDTQQSLVNYNTATNSIMKNYSPLDKSFNEEGYKLEAAIDSALVDAMARLEKAGKEQGDTAKYSAIYHNIGVTNHMRNDLNAAAEAYKEALRKNPDDEDARYNLAVILHQMKNNDQQQNQQDQQQEQEQEQKQEQQQEQQQNKEQQQQQNQQEKEQEQQQQQQQAQPQKSDEEMSKENAARLLEAAMQDEKAVLEKVNREKNQSGKNKLEKNW